jgi:hypothetical protein
MIMQVINIIIPYLQVLYFLSGCIIAIAAIIALNQIKVAKKALKTQSKRDSLKLTATECARYFDKIIPLQNELNEAINDNKVNFFKGWQVKIDANQIELSRNSNFDMDNFDSIGNQLTTVCNSMESFAAYFVSGVADEYVAYNTVGTTFILTLDILIPWVVSCRKDGYYKNLIELYGMWKKRRDAFLLSQEREKIDRQLSKIGTKKIYPIGVD